VFGGQQVPFPRWQGLCAAGGGRGAPPPPPPPTPSNKHTRTHTTKHTHHPGSPLASNSVSATP
jgi:hypothetical protein